MTNQEWNRLTPAEAKGVVVSLARMSQNAAAWETAMAEEIPGNTTTTTTDPSGQMWMGMWMAFHRGQVISGGV